MINFVILPYTHTNTHTEGDQRNMITLDWLLDQKEIFYKGHYWDNWQNLNMDCKLDNSIKSGLPWWRSG